MHISNKIVVFSENTARFRFTSYYASFEQTVHFQEFKGEFFICM